MTSCPCSAILELSGDNSAAPISSLNDISEDTIKQEPDDPGYSIDIKEEPYDPENSIDIKEEPDDQEYSIDIKEEPL